jgi:hypothetical protein
MRFLTRQLPPDTQTDLFPMPSAPIRPSSLLAGSLLAVLATSATVLANDPLAPLSDEFDDAASLAGWMRIHETEGWNADQLQLLDVDATVPGALVMRPWTSTWYQDWRGEMTYKLVTGNFAFTIDVTASGADGVGLPEAAFSLGGAMIRTPRPISTPAQWTPGGENYVFLSVGQALSNGPCLPGPGAHLEVKTTTNSVSDLCIEPTPIASAEIQIARIGSAVICLYRTPGGAWEVHRRYTRADMPATLQVGLVSYTDWFKASTYTPFFHNGHVLNAALVPNPTSNPAQPFFPDVQATFGYARFASVSVPPELAGVDLVTQASDAQLLAFLGANANPEPGRDPVPADLNGDGSVDAADLALLLGSWGTSGNDLTGDGTVDASDLAILLGAWGG